MACVYIFGIIISKPSPEQEFSLIVLLEIDENLKISLYSTILRLCFIVCLRIESSKEFSFNANKIAKQ